MAKKKGTQGPGRTVRFDLAHLLGVLGCSREAFHRDIKPAILKDFRQEIASKGVQNPDIAVDDLGNVALLDPRDGRIMFTDVPLDSYAVTP